MTGKFADQDDVASRFEGEFPSGRLDWVDVTIFDVENVLMGLVPSLRKTVDEINAQSAEVGDPDRIERVKALVCRKVLDLFRNPDGAVQVSQTMEQDSATRSYGFYRDDTRGRIAFTDAELDGVKLRRKRRTRFGTIGVAPWRVTCS